MNPSTPPSAPRDVFSGLRELMHSMPAREIDHAQIIRRALTVASQQEAAARKPAASSWLWSFGFAGLAALGLLVWIARSLPVTPGSPVTASLREARIESGEVRMVEGKVLSRGEALPAERPLLVASAEATLHLAHAKVQAPRGTRLAWRAEGAAVALDAGEVNVAVDPGPQKRFRVETAHFAVVVLGTRFQVDAESVRVTQGKVRIEDREGHVLDAEVGAGEEWRWQESQALARRGKPASPGGETAAAAEGQAEPARTQAEPAAGNTESRSKAESAAETRGDAASPSQAAETSTASEAKEQEGSKRAAERREVAKRTRRENAEEEEAEAPRRQNSAAAPWLALAREQLAARSFDRAQSAVEQALRKRPSRAESAEAETLRAEVYRMSGRYGDASRVLLGVADRYQDLAAGENALFAAAKLLSQAGDTQRAGILFQRYLMRYPTGRFHREASRRLQALQTP